MSIPATLQDRPRVAVGPVSMFIDGVEREGSGTPITIHDPSHGSVLAQYLGASEADVDDAVQSAARAFEGEWGRLSPVKRQALLWRLSDALETHAEEFALLESVNTGKPIELMRKFEVPQAVDLLRYNAGWATKLNGETREVSLPGEWHAYTRRDPVGVVGLIVPWNSPLVMTVAKLAAALAAGCTAVIKPAEITPLTALRLGALATEIGFPPGVINVIPGLGTVAGEALATHSLVQKVSFTGSTAVGRHLQRTTADGLKRLSLELGGKSPVVIFADADLERAIDGAAKSIFNNTGQVCAAGSRLFVEASVADRVIAGIAERAQRITIGGALEPGVVMGPLVSAAQRDRVLGYIEAGIAEGAQLATGGSAAAGDGYFIEPTVLTHTTPEMSVVSEEIFGPVLVTQTFDDPDDLNDIAARANGSEYGLAAYIWTNNIGRAHGLAKRLKTGNIRINAATGMDANMPFGGVGSSGYGKENGREGVEAFTELTSVAINLSY